MWSLPTWPATRSGKSWTPLGRGSPESAKSTPCCSRFSGTAVFPCEIAPSTYSAKLFSDVPLDFEPGDILVAFLCEPVQHLPEHPAGVERHVLAGGEVH